MPKGQDGRRPGVLKFAGVCLKIGTVGFGGGYAVLELIRTELVQRRQWLTSNEFEDILSTVQLAPGPTTVNLLGALGARLAGWRALLLGIGAVVLPSFAIIVALAAVYLRYAQTPTVVGAMAGLAAAVIGLMAAVTVDLGRDVQRGLLHWGIAGAACLVVAFTAVNPIWVIVAAAAIGGVQVALHRH